MIKDRDNAEGSAACCQSVRLFERLLADHTPAGTVQLFVSVFFLFVYIVPRITSFPSVTLGDTHADSHETCLFQCVACILNCSFPHHKQQFTVGSIHWVPLSSWDLCSRLFKPSPQLINAELILISDRRLCFPLNLHMHAGHAIPLTHNGICIVTLVL